MATSKMEDSISALVKEMKDVERGKAQQQRELRHKTQQLEKLRSQLEFEREWALVRKTASLTIANHRVSLSVFCCTDGPVSGCCNAGSGASVLYSALEGGELTANGSHDC